MSTTRTADHEPGRRTTRHAGQWRLAAREVVPDDVGDAPVLLVPGFTGSKEDWIAVLGPIAATGRHVVAIDLPGQYDSPGPPERGDTTLDGLGAAVVAVARDLAVETETGPHLVGHSLGGLVARAAVLADPSAFRSLVLVGSGPAAPVDDGLRARRLAAVEEVAGDGMAAVHDRLVEVGGEADLPAEERAFLRERFVASSLPAYLGMFDGLLAEPDRVDALRATGLPVLVLRGRDDEVWPSTDVDTMAGRLGADLVLIDDADHSPALENPGPTVAALQAFWDGVVRT